MSFSRYLFAALIVALAVPVFAPLAATSATPTPAALGTLPPLQTIEHLIARPLCFALKQNIGPAINSVLDNDKLIAKTAPLLSDYNDALSLQSGNSARKNIILLRMSNMVGPLVKNIQVIKEKLNDPEVFPRQATNQESALLLATRQKLNDILQWQNAQLDIVNGFVQTQQMHQMQYDGFGYLGAVNVPDTKLNPTATPTPNSLYIDKNLQAGLSNSVSPAIDFAMIPGLRLGYNPLSNLIAGVHYAQHMTHIQEQHAAVNVMTATRICSPGARLVPVTPHP